MIQFLALVRKPSLGLSNQKANWPVSVVGPAQRFAELDSFTPMIWTGSPIAAALEHQRDEAAAIRVEHSVCKEVANHCPDLLRMSLEREVARVEEVDARLGNVAPERLGTLR